MDPWNGGAGSSQRRERPTIEPVDTALDGSWASSARVARMKSTSPRAAVRRRLAATASTPRSATSASGDLAFSICSRSFLDLRRVLLGHQSRTRACPSRRALRSDAPSHRTSAQRRQQAHRARGRVTSDTGSRKRRPGVLLRCRRGRRRRGASPIAGSVRHRWRFASWIMSATSASPIDEGGAVLFATAEARSPSCWRRSRRRLPSAAGIGTRALEKKTSNTERKASPGVPADLSRGRGERAAQRRSLIEWRLVDRERRRVDALLGRDRQAGTTATRRRNPSGPRSPKELRHLVRS